MGITGTNIKGIDVARSGVATHYIKKQNIPHLKEKIREYSKNEITFETLFKLCSGYSDYTYNPKTYTFKYLDY